MEMICVVCGRPFERKEKGISMNRKKFTRPSMAITCSKNCTKKRADGRNPYYKAYRKRPEVIARMKINSRKSYLKKNAKKVVKSKDL